MLGVRILAFTMDNSPIRDGVQHDPRSGIIRSPGIAAGMLTTTKISDPRIFDANTIENRTGSVCPDKPNEVSKRKGGKL